MFDILVGVAADSKTAQAQFSQEQAQAQTLLATKLPPSVQIKFNSANTAGIGDRAVTVTGTTTVLGKQISFTAIDVLEGATFFTIGDLVIGVTPPTVAAMQAQAQTVIGRL